MVVYLMLIDTINKVFRSNVSSKCFWPTFQIVWQDISFMLKKKKKKNIGLTFLC